MAPITQERLVAKEVALGALREIPPPQDHIGWTLAPYQTVQSDEVIFGYLTVEVDGLAPARAEDSESELAQKDSSVGTGRASVIDWAIKDHYDASDVSRFREFQRIAELVAQGGSFPLTIGQMTEDFPARLARDARSRLRKLENRHEWLVMTGLVTGSVIYNDGKIKFTTSWGRPGGQQDQAPPGGLWSLTTSDPLGDINAMKDTMYNTYYVEITRAITSRKVLRSILNSTKFQARGQFTGADIRYGTANGGVGLGYDDAVRIIEAATGVRFQTYDSVYRTRALGTNTVVNNRFMAEDKVLFLPDPANVAEMSDFGFGATLSSPHPEGNWTSGYYEWEKDTGPDPWGTDRGTGIKMYPIFPILETSYVMDVLT